jgi:hypothetical protein
VNVPLAQVSAESLIQLVPWVIGIGATGVMSFLMLRIRDKFVTREEWEKDMKDVRSKVEDINERSDLRYRENKLSINEIKPIIETKIAAFETSRTSLDVELRDGMQKLSEQVGYIRGQIDSLLQHKPARRQG